MGRGLPAYFAAALMACAAPAEMATMTSEPPDAGPRRDAPPRPPDGAAGPPAATFGELSPALVSDIAQPDFVVSDPVLSTFPDKTYPTVIQTQIAIGDLDGDGYLDLFVAPSVSYPPPSDPPMRLQVWLNNGDGTFYDGTAALLADDARSVVTAYQATPYLADFNGDGQLDVFIRDSIYLASVNKLLLSGPDGLLHDASAKLPVTYGAFVTSAWVGDIDGDGCADVAVATLAHPDVPGRGGEYFLFGDCLGNFSRVTDRLPAELAETLSGVVGPDLAVFPLQTTMVDLDGNGQPDLACCASFLHAASLDEPPLRVYGNDGLTFSLREAVTAYPYGFNCESIAFGDIDGDGRPDLAITYSGMEGDQHLSVFHNAGGFDLEASNSTFASVGNFSPVVDLRDVNGDGHPDLIRVLGIDSVSALAGDFTESYQPPLIELNDGHGQFTAWSFTKDGSPASSDDVMAAFPGDAAPHAENLGLPLVFDANGDGVVDIVLVSPHFRDTVPHTVDRYRIYTILAPPR